MRKFVSRMRLMNSLHSELYMIEGMLSVLNVANLVMRRIIVEQGHQNPTSHNPNRSLMWIRRGSS